MRAPAPEAVKVTPELIMQLRRPLDLAVSADGERVAYIVSPSFREKGQPLESRLWIDGTEATEAGAADALPRFAPDGTLAYASDRGHRGPHERVDRRPRRARRHRGLGGGHPVVARRQLAARARGGPRLRPSRRTDGDEDQGGRCRGRGSEGLPPGCALAPAVPDRRGLGRDARGEPRRRQRVRVRLGGRQRRRGLHRRAVRKRVVRRLDRARQPRFAQRRARPHARVAAPVPAHLARRSRRVDRRVRLRPRRRDRHRAPARRRPARARARRDVARLRRRGDALVRRLAAQRLDGRTTLGRRDVRGALRRRRRGRAALPAQDLAERGRIHRRDDLREPVRPAGGRRSSRTARRGR